MRNRAALYPAVELGHLARNNGPAVSLLQDTSSPLSNLRVGGGAVFEHLLKRGVQTCNVRFDLPPCLELADLREMALLCDDDRQPHTHRLECGHTQALGVRGEDET